MRHFPQIDALRGVAILLVLVGHAAKNSPLLGLGPIARYCFSGVDLFFVLSGFLITGILLDARSRPDYLRNFYAKRVLRIWPLYFAVLCLWFVVAASIPHIRTAVYSGTTALWSYPLFLQNLASVCSFGPVQITWSLAVEEQFYLAWPLLVLLMPRRWLVRFVIFAVGVALGARLGVQVGWWRLDTYHNTICRVDAIASGCAIALLDVCSVKLARYMLGLAVGVTVGACVFRDLEFGYYSGFALLYASVLVLAKESEHPFWRNRFLLYTGRISYSLYLLHLLSFDLVREILGKLHRSGLLIEAAGFVVSIGGAYALAALSWRYVESPLLKLKSRLRTTKNVIPDLGRTVSAAS